MEQALQRQFETFTDQLLHDIAPQPPKSALEPTLRGSRHNSLTGDLLGCKGERYVQTHLIFPILRLLGYSFRPEYYIGKHNDHVDFAAAAPGTVILGETKRPNRYKNGLRDIKEYLSTPGVETRYGMVTDGFNWVFVVQNDAASNSKFEYRFPHDIRGLLARALDDHPAVEETFIDDPLYSRGTILSDLPMDTIPAGGEEMAREFTSEYNAAHIHQLIS